MFNSRQQGKRTDFPNMSSLLQGRNLVELSLTVPLKCSLLSGPFCYSQLAVEDVYKQDFFPLFLFFFLLTAFFFFFCFVFESVFVFKYLFVFRERNCSCPKSWRSLGLHCDSKQDYWQNILSFVK